MPSPTLPKVSDVNGDMELQDLANLVGKVLKELNWLLTGNLDVENIRAKSITADRLTVNELSAISANLGHITAGLIEAVTIVGSLIKTANAGQRVELSSTENLLKAVNDAGGQVAISPNFQGSPGVVFDYNGSGTLMFALADGFYQTSTRDIFINPTSPYKIKVSNWDKLLNNLTNRTLQQDLNSINAWLSQLDQRVANLESVVYSSNP